MNRKHHAIIKRKHTVLAHSQPWDMLIEEATQRLQEAEVLCARLRVAIEHYEKQRRSGIPFPGMERIKEDGLLPVAANE